MNCRFKKLFLIELILDKQIFGGIVLSAPSNLRENNDCGM